MKTKEKFTINEHFIPKFFTSFWSVDNKIKRVDLEASKHKGNLYIKETHYQNCFFQKDLYELKVTDKDTNIVKNGYLNRNLIENNYSKFEDKYSIWFRELLKKLDNSSFYDEEVLNEHDRYLLMYFVLQIFQRNPEAKGLVKLFDDIPSDMTYEEKRDTLFWMSNNIISNFKEDDYEKVGKKLCEGTNLYIIKSKENLPFILGDTPVLHCGKNSYYMHLSKDYALVTVHKKFKKNSKFSKKNRNKLIPINKNDVFLANQKMLEYARENICIPLTASCEQVEKLNTYFKEIIKDKK